MELGCPSKKSARFDCKAGRSNWRSEWSKEKRQWCCARDGTGCYGNEFISKKFNNATMDYATMAPSWHLDAAHVLIGACLALMLGFLALRIRTEWLASDRRLATVNHLNIHAEGAE